MHHTIGMLGLISAIAFAFGERVARAIVGSALIIAALHLRTSWYGLCQARYDCNNS